MGCDGDDGDVDNEAGAVAGTDAAVGLDNCGVGGGGDDDNRP